MNIRKLRAGALTVASVALFAGQLSAAPITGVLNITGSVRVSATEIDWEIADPEGTVLTVTPSSGYFGAIVSPNPLLPYGADAIDLVGGVQVMPDMLNGFTAPGYAGLTFDLTDIIEPTAANCTGGEGVNVSCRFGVFLLTNVGGGNTTITLLLAGNFEDPTLGRPGGPFEATPYTGTYTTQLNNRSISSIVQDISGVGCTAGGELCDGSITASYSGNFNAEGVIPEPGTVAMMLGGLALVAGARFRRRHQ